MSAGVLALLMALPASRVLAHATLVSSDPAAGAVLAASPATVSATFAEPFAASRSSMELLRPDGTTLAMSTAATSSTAETMTISGFGALIPGTYSVRWITITPDDNGIERGTFAFTVGASGEAGSAAAGAVATAGPSPGAGGSSGSGGSGDIAIALVVLACLVLAGLAWFVRRSR